jgi:hypothetical protein
MAIDPLVAEQVMQKAIIFYPPGVFTQFLTVYGLIILAVGMALGVGIYRVYLTHYAYEDEEEGEE